MKIALSGSQCTGKTTLINFIIEKNEFKDYKIIKEVVRTLLDAGEITKINKKAGHASQMRILEEHYKNQWLYKNYFTDRCALDAFVYSLWDYLNGDYTLTEHLQHEALFLKTISSIDKIFLLEPVLKMEVDGTRDTDIKYQTTIHKLFLQVIEKYNLGHLVVVLSGTPDERYELLKKWL